MTISYRPGQSADGLALFRVHVFAIEDLLHRKGIVASAGEPTEEAIAEEWEEIASLYQHLAHAAEYFWVAEEEGEIVGYARSCSQDGVRELTELFVHPRAQGQGVGKELLRRAFPHTEARRRCIIATSEAAAQTLYMRSGVYARHLIYRFMRAPQAQTFASGPQSDLEIEAAANTPATLAHFATIDRTILEFQRDADHHWFLADRQAWLYRRHGEVVGYGYTGRHNGPFALLEPSDFPAVIAHAEQLAAAAAHEEVAFWVHSPNRYVVDHLLTQGYKLSPFYATFLSDAPFGQLDRYVNTQPPFIL